MMESTCLEWAVLISIILRDAMAVIRIVNAAKASDVPQDSTNRLKEGLASLERWADREWYTTCNDLITKVKFSQLFTRDTLFVLCSLGYKRFMHTIRSQSVALSRISCSKLRIRSPSPNAYLEMDTPPSSSGEPPDLENELMAISDKEYDSQGMDEVQTRIMNDTRTSDHQPYQQLRESRKETHGTECVIS